VRSTDPPEDVAVEDEVADSFAFSFPHAAANMMRAANFRALTLSLLGFCFGHFQDGMEK
jgi:hypothetical protein